MWLHQYLFKVSAILFRRIFYCPLFKREEGFFDRDFWVCFRQDNTHDYDKSYMKLLKWIITAKYYTSSFFPVKVVHYLYYFLNYKYFSYHDLDIITSWKITYQKGMKCVKNKHWPFIIGFCLLMFRMKGRINPGRCFFFGV